PEVLSSFHYGSLEEAGREMICMQADRPAPAFGLKPTPDLGSSPPWIRRLAFAAQAPDLPMRRNEDGFAVVGPLADPHRPCIGFLSVASQL
ncbi:MAG: hypothetical protein R6U98_13940, partial [Pirellulaceae bacterium]